MLGWRSSRIFFENRERKRVKLGGTVGALWLACRDLWHTQNRRKPRTAWGSPDVKKPNREGLGFEYGGGTLARHRQQHECTQNRMLLLLRTDAKGLTGAHPTSKPAWFDHFSTVDTGYQSLPLSNLGHSIHVQPRPPRPPAGLATFPKQSVHGLPFTTRSSP